MRIDEDMLTRILCTLYRICRSPHCRMPQEAVSRRLPSYLRGLVKEVLEELRRRGLVYKAGGKGKTYGLTREGLERARETCEVE